MQYKYITVKHHCYKTFILQQPKIRNIWINKFIVLNVCPCCQVILIVDDVILSSSIAGRLCLIHNLANECLILGR